MVTVQVDEKVRKRLFSYAARLQGQSGKKVSLSDAIEQLLDAQATDGPDKSKLLALFGVLKGEKKNARNMLRKLRQREERAIEQKYRAARKPRA